MNLVFLQNIFSLPAHKVGRTGRAGSKGIAISFIDSITEGKYADILVSIKIFHNYDS